MEQEKLDKFNQDWKDEYKMKRENPRIRDESSLYANGPEVSKDMLNPRVKDDNSIACLIAIYVNPRVKDDNSIACLIAIYANSK